MLYKTPASKIDKNAIRAWVSAAASVYLNSKGYTLARKLFNHALWGFGSKPSKNTCSLIKEKLRGSKTFKSAVKKIFFLQVKKVLSFQVEIYIMQYKK